MKDFLVIIGRKDPTETRKTTLPFDNTARFFGAP
jgi:hypothetical protein